MADHGFSRYRGKRVDSTKLPRRPKSKNKPGGKDWKKRGPLPLLGLAAAVVTGWAVAIWSFQRQKARKTASDRVILDRLLGRPIRYSEHAACRMGCRFIGEAEVMETLKKGRIDDRKSDPGSRPCPKYVVDCQVGPKKKNVEAVFSGCRESTNVVTVIDQDTNWECYCP